MDEKKAALKQLDKLVGKWNIEIVLPTDPPMQVTARATFEWMPGNAFLVQRSQADNPDFPKGESIIGCDDELETYAMLQSDSRGIMRIYSMSLTDNEWRTWRDDPNFSQRFIGTFSADGNTITGRIEKSFDTVNWGHDFDITYTRA